VDNEGYTAMDLAVIKQNYEVALQLKKSGASPKAPEFYEGKTWTKYDVELFMEWLEEGRESIEYKVLFYKVKKAEQEWQSRDLVVDIRETWGQFFHRQLNFEDPKLVPREELPEQFQPHRSFYGKLANYVNGKDPYPPEKEEELSNPLEQQNSRTVNLAKRKNIPLRSADTEDFIKKPQNQEEPKHEEPK